MMDTSHAAPPSAALSAMLLLSIAGRSPKCSNRHFPRRLAPFSRSASAGVHVTAQDYRLGRIAEPQNVRHLPLSTESCEIPSAKKLAPRRKAGVALQVR